MSNLINGVNDLESYCQNNNKLYLLDEWDYDKNVGIMPSSICYGTSKKVWWIGPCGHSYQSSLNKRTSDGTGCPYCCSSHAKLLRGFNDLATTNPELLAYWDYDKNGVLRPTDVMKGSHKKVWWHCDIGHTYESAVYHRVNGRGCPICRKENQTSFPEQAIYYYLKQQYPDAISADRFILDGKELDIYIPSINIGIEFDGSSWHKDVKKDIEKNQLCAQKGITLIRIRDVDCPNLPECDNVFIVKHESYTDSDLIKCIKSIAHILHISICVDLETDRPNIYNQYLAQKKEKSLGEEYPELVAEWHPTKNGNLTPYMVTKQSDKKVWWLGKCGHEWQAVIHSRTKGHNCPYCNSNRLLDGFNDLGTTYPQLISIFDSEKNGRNISEVSPNENISLFWKCSNGHSFKRHLKTMIKHIVDLDSMCPYCNNSKIDYTVKNIDYKGADLTLDKTNPECLIEWDYEKNTLSPNQCTKGSSKKVWWICPRGHSYESAISNHIVLKRGCPYCNNTKVLKGYNDLLSQNPKLASEWDNNKNDCSAENVIYGGRKKYWWLCPYGHSYYTSIEIRKKGSGCPYCDKSAKKSVLNIDTGKIFKSLSDAAKFCGLKVGDTISLCCQGKQKTAGGYHWKYVDEEE